jgi:hypothetical protein
MPKRTDLKSILIIGAGPIIIGQACEFDYSGVQACKALREEGYKVILINSNPATIMTDPATADVTYIEPITWQTVEKIIAKERPDAILPTMGGQTALNCALDLWRNGVLAKYDVELIGATPEAIDKAEDRLKFKDAMTKIGLGSARSGIAHTMDEAWAVQKTLGFPTVICSAGKSTRWKWCATPRTTASSSARSKTLTRWVCIPATRSPWPPRRRSPTRNTRSCAMPRWPCCVRSASTPVARTCSSPSTRRTAAWSSSR